jgi:hypothetical protein
MASPISPMRVVDLGVPVVPVLAPWNAGALVPQAGNVLNTLVGVQRVHNRRIAAAEGCAGKSEPDAQFGGTWRAGDDLAPLRCLLWSLDHGFISLEPQKSVSEHSGWLLHVWWWWWCKAKRQV